MITPEEVTFFQDFYDYAWICLSERLEDIDRRYEVFAKARLALQTIPFNEAMERLSGEPSPYLPVYVMGLRDMTAYLAHEVKPAWFRKKFGSEAKLHLYLEGATGILKKYGLDTEQQPNWREEAFKLYHLMVNENRNIDGINSVALRYLLQRERDAEEGY